jgi:competence transcription factor ComK
MNMHTRFPLKISVSINGRLEPNKRCMLNVNTLRKAKIDQQPRKQTSLIGMHEKMFFHEVLMCYSAKFVYNSNTGKKKKTQCVIGINETRRFRAYK